MTRGEVYWVEFPAGVGGEVRKSRPAVLVSNNRSLAQLNRAQVIPLTTNVERIFPGEALVTFDGRQSKVMATQIGTVDKSRIGRLMGQLGSADMLRVDLAIRTQLGLV